MADLAPPRGKSAENSCQKSLVWSDIREEVWFGSFFQRLIVFSWFLLHDIWVVFFLNLSQELRLVLLLYCGTLGDGYSLKGSKKWPSRHRMFCFALSKQSVLQNRCAKIGRYFFFFQWSKVDSTKRQSCCSSLFLEAGSGSAFEWNLDPNPQLRQNSEA